MCNDVVDLDVLMVSYSFHCEFVSFLEITVGCAKKSLGIDPILFNWIHPVPGFYCVLEFPRTVNNRVGNVGSMDLVVQGSSQLPIF